MPFLSAGNWGGSSLHLRGNVEAFVQAASEQKWLEIHGLEHWTEFYTDYGLALQHRFFDHFLKDEDNGWRDRPRVSLWVRHPDRFEVRGEDDWPLMRTRWTTLHLQPDGSLSDSEPDTGSELSFEATGDGVVFTTPAMTEPLEVTGPSSLRLSISSSTSNAAVSAMRRAPQLGQIPRRLQLNATSFSALQDSHATRRNPCSSRPHFR